MRFVFGLRPKEEVKKRIPHSTLGRIVRKKSKKRNYDTLQCASELARESAARVARAFPPQHHRKWNSSQVLFCQSKVFHHFPTHHRRRSARFVIKSPVCFIFVRFCATKLLTRKPTEIRCFSGVLLQAAAWSEKRYNNVRIEVMTTINVKTELKRKARAK